MPPKRGFVPEDLWLLRMVSDPQVSPDGSRVAFVVASPDKETDKPAATIWVAPADGSSKARRFTSGPEDSSPRWSPDGRWLAFVAERGHGPQLHLASLDGGEAFAMTEMAHGVSQPAWSPDGTELAFVARTGEWKKHEDRNALERSAPRVITGLYSRYDGVGWFDVRRSHLFVVAAEGGEPRQITDGGLGRCRPGMVTRRRQAHLCLRPVGDPLRQGPPGRVGGAGRCRTTAAAPHARARDGGVTAVVTRWDDDRLHRSRA